MQQALLLSPHPPSSPLPVLSHLIRTTPLGVEYIYPSHFVDEKMEDQLWKSGGPWNSLLSVWSAALTADHRPVIREVPKS